MTVSTGLWWRGIIRRAQSSSPIYIHALRTTAEFYGWDVAFDERRSAVALPVRPDLRQFARPVRQSPRVGGRRMQISRAASKIGKVKGCVNEFRIAKAAGDHDIAQVAAATRGEWHWLTDKNGRRIDRAVWLQTVI